MAVCQKNQNKKTTTDGITFESRTEAARYRELKLLERGGLITDLKIHPSFELSLKYKKNSRTVRRMVLSYFLTTFNCLNSYLALTTDHLNYCRQGLEKAKNRLTKRFLRWLKIVISTR